MDPHICLLIGTSKQSISVGHSRHYLSVLCAAKEREDIKNFGLLLRKTVKLISSEANTDDVVEAANILTTKQIKWTSTVLVRLNSLSLKHLHTFTSSHNASVNMHLNTLICPF